MELLKTEGLGMSLPSRIFMQTKNAVITMLIHMSGKSRFLHPNSCREYIAVEVEFSLAPEIRVSCLHMLGGTYFVALFCGPDRIKLKE